MIFKQKPEKPFLGLETLAEFFVQSAMSLSLKASFSAQVTSLFTSTCVVQALERKTLLSAEKTIPQQQ